MARCHFYNHSAEIFDKSIKKGGVYVFERGKIKLDNDVIVLSMDEHSSIYEVADDNSIPMYYIKFTTIKDII